MVLRPSRALVRSAVAVVAVALPLVAVGSAQAAIAGAPQAQSTVLPDLVSATALTSSNPNQAEIEVVFDKPISSYVASNFYITNYLSGNDLSDADLIPAQAVIDPSNGDAVDLIFDNNAGTIDIDDNTIVTADGTNDGFFDPNGSAVVSDGVGNIADSTTLSSSDSHVGTRGVTYAPELTSVAPDSNPADSGLNTLVYTFNHNIDPDEITGPFSGFFASLFWYENVYGDFNSGATIVGYGATDNQVVVSFPTTTVGNPDDFDQQGGFGLTSSVNDAIQGGIGAVSATSVQPYEAFIDLQNVSFWPESYPIAGLASPITQIPTLVSATFNAAYTKVTYTFDQVVNSPIASEFGVTLVDGDTFFGSGTPTVNGDSVTVTIDGLSTLPEYAVEAFVDSDAVSPTVVPTGLPEAGPAVTFDSIGGATLTNTPGNVPLGGNAGASSRGYTTGPDVGTATWLANGVLQVTTDDTADVLLPYELTLYNNAGDEIFYSAPASSVSLITGPLGFGASTLDIEVPSSVTDQDPTVVQFPQDTLFTDGLIGIGDDNAYNVPQATEITGTAAHLKSLKLAKKAL